MIRILQLQSFYVYRQATDPLIRLSFACSHRPKEWSACQNGEMSFELELEHDELVSIIQGSGRDIVGSFAILGLFNEQIIRFIRSYSDGSNGPTLGSGVMPKT
jgi:hypothetical protein